MPLELVYSQQYHSQSVFIHVGAEPHPPVDEVIAYAREHGAITEEEPGDWVFVIHFSDRWPELYSEEALRRSSFFKVKPDIRDYLGESVWSEDDALPHDRERLETAIPRLTGMSGNRKERTPELEIDGGDSAWEIYPEWVICRSYPGATGIYKRKKDKL